MPPPVNTTILARVRYVFAVTAAFISTLASIGTVYYCDSVDVNSLDPNFQKEISTLSDLMWALGIWSFLVIASFIGLRGLYFIAYGDNLEGDVKMLENTVALTVTSITLTLIALFICLGKGG
jgi:hypothetical protein